MNHEPNADTAPRLSADSLLLQIEGGTWISVPATLSCFTSYILLEQERWFERDGAFFARWLTKGMTVVDVGANVGVVALPAARLAGSTGRVYAYEPGNDNRRHLEAGMVANGVDNLVVSGFALSDSERDGLLRKGASGELHALVAGDPEGGETERVRVSSLDAEAKRLGWNGVDLVKIDAEGQEARILAGGRDFFARQSPLVVYEIRQGYRINDSLRWMLATLGYDTYRLLGDASCLIPVASDEKLDDDTINLFAAKPDRAGQLAEAGLLVPGEVAHRLSATERRHSMEVLVRLPYAKAFGMAEDDIDACPYAAALEAYAAFRFGGLPAERRVAALTEAHRKIREYCGRETSVSALATLVRIATDFGNSCETRNALAALCRLAMTELDGPFLPPAGRYEQIDPSGAESEWFTASVYEQKELSTGFSSLFTEADYAPLIWLSRSRFSSPEMTRRLILRSLRGNATQEQAAEHLNPSHRHLNSSYWTREGMALLIALRETNGGEAQVAPKQSWIERHGASLNDRLSRITRKETPTYALLLPDEGGRISGFSRGYPQALSCWSPAPFRLVSAEGSGSSRFDADLVIAMVERCDAASRVHQLRMQIPEASVIALWLLGNDDPVANFRTIALADLVFPCGFDEADSLTNPVAVIAGPVPDCCTRWTHEEAGRLFREFGQAANRRPLLDGEDGIREEPCEGRESESGDQFARLCSAKAVIIQWAPERITPDFFDALLAGMVPIVPEDVAELDRLISPETQKALGIVKARNAAGGLGAAVDEAIAHFDAGGIEGAAIRHRYVMEHHMLANRVTGILHTVWMLGSGKAAVAVRSVASSAALYVVSADKRRPVGGSL